MSRFRLAGGPIPAGPMKGGLPAFGGQIARAERGAAPRNHRSKKSYAGTVAGVGRPATRGVNRLAGVPAGPRAHTFQSTQLPARKRFAGVPPVEFRPAAARPPSLMTRIGSRIRRGAAALGL